MNLSDLPPGVSVMDEHINPDDPWEQVINDIQKDCDKNKMTDCDCFIAWQLGLAAFKTAKQLCAKFPSD